MSETATLTCPKCRGAMSSYERAGVVIDQCTECRGIFLDRGELERLLDVASETMAPSAPPQPQQPQQPQQPIQPQWSAPAPDRAWRQQQPQQSGWQNSRHDWDDDSDSDRRRHGGQHSGGYYTKKKSKTRSMLGDLFDF